MPGVEIEEKFCEGIEGRCLRILQPGLGLLPRMQGAASRHQFRRLICHSNDHRFFLTNSSFPQFRKASTDDHRHLQDLRESASITQCPAGTLSDSGRLQDRQKVYLDGCWMNPQESTCFEHPTGANAESSHCKSCLSQSNDEEFGSLCVASVLLVLEKHGWGHQTEVLLQSIATELNLETVTKIVDGLRNTKVAFSFLQWVGTQENYKHKEEVFTKVVSKMGANGEFEAALEVFHYMKNYGLKVDYAFGVFVCQLKSKTLADTVVKAMESMESLGVLPTVSLYSMAIQVTLKVNAISTAERLYQQMREAGLQLDAKLSGILITGFGRIGMTDRALFFFKELQRDGVPPDSFVYISLIRAFGIAGQYVEGQKFFSEMVQNKCLPVALSPKDLKCALFGLHSMPQIYGFLDTLESTGHHISVHTYNSVLQYFVDGEMLLEAVELFQRLLGAGTLQASNGQQSEKPNKVSYSVLICGLCKGGYLTDAMFLFKEMLLNRVSTTPDVCNCLLHGLSSTEGFLYEAMELAGHIARTKTLVEPQTLKTFFRALKVGKDISDARKVFEMMKKKGCIDPSSNFYEY